MRATRDLMCRRGFFVRQRVMLLTPSAGRGRLDPSRFKRFPIEQDGHFLAVCRYDAAFGG